MASNHKSYLDPFLIGAAAPTEICYLAKKEVFGWPVLGYLARKYNAVPTRRRGIDLEVFRTAKSILDGKKPLLIFIEGTRSRDSELLPAKKGVGLISFQNQVDVLPVYVHGSLSLPRALLRSPRVVVQFGKKISIKNYAKLNLSKRETYSLISEDVMQAIKELRNSL